MTAQTAFGYSNYVKTATITATNEETALPATNVATDHGAESTAWQTEDGETDETLTIAFGSDLTFRAAGIFRTNLTSGASIVWTLKDGGSTVWTTTTTGPIAGYRQVVVVADQDYTGDTLTIAITDNSNTDGFLNVPLAFAGQLFILEYATAIESTYGRRDDISELRSRGGQEFPTQRWVQRVYNFMLAAVVDSESYAYVGELDRLARLGGNVLFVPDINSSAIGYEAVFGRLKDAQDVNFSMRATGVRSYQGSMFERL